MQERLLIFFVIELHIESVRDHRDKTLQGVEVFVLTEYTDADRFSLVRILGKRKRFRQELVTHLIDTA